MSLIEIVEPRPPTVKGLQVDTYDKVSLSGGERDIFKMELIFVVLGHLR